MVTEIELFESPNLTTSLDEERSLQKTGGHTDELLARILDAAACIKRREDQLRRTTRDLSKVY